MKPNDYWEECLSIAAEECGLSITPEQLKYMTDAVSGAHECYGMAFYSPPASDRLSSIEREWKDKLDAVQRQFDSYVAGAEKAVRVALKQYPDTAVRIHNDGSVYRVGGRTEQIL